MHTCKNCENQFEGNFCNRCGQRHISERLVLKNLLNDFLTLVFNVNSPLFKTVKGLTVAPAHLVEAYLHGKRKSFYSPVKYYLFTLAIYLLIRALLDFDPVENQFRAMGREMPTGDNLPQSIRVSHFLAKHMNLFMILLIPILAGYAKIFFRKATYNYTETAVLFFFLVGHILIFTTAIIPAAVFIHPTLFYLTYLAIFLYLGYGLTQFYEGRLALRLIKSLIVIVIGYVSYVGTAFFLAFIFVRYFNFG